MSEPQWVSMMQPMTFESQVMWPSRGDIGNLGWGQENPVKILPRSSQPSCRRARLTQCLADTSTALMDSRHRGEVLSAGAAVGFEMKNLYIWKRSSPGQGAF